ncbi:MAG: tyrosine-type recombinase/integrase [Pseudomonadota bacterium]
MARNKPKPKPAEVGPVRVTAMRGPREDARYYWRGRRKVERDTVWTGWATREEAMAAVARLVAAGAHQRSAASADQAPPKTVDDLLARYLAHRKSQVWEGDQRARPKTQRGLIHPQSYHKYELHAGHLSAWIGDLLLNRLDENILTTYAVNRRYHDTRPSRSDRSVERELAFLGFAWNWGRDKGWVSGTLPPVLQPDPEVYVNNHYNPTQAEVRAVLAHLDGDYRLAVEQYAWNGARLREISEKLTLADVDLDAQTLTLHGKRGKVRTVPIHPQHLAWMTERKRAGAPGDLLLEAPPEEIALRVTGRRHIYASTMRLKLAAACDAAGVPHFTAQGVRRYVDDLLYGGHNDPSTSGDLLGHSPEVSLRAYRKVRASEKRSAMRRAGLGAALLPEGDNVIALCPPDEACSGLEAFTIEDLIAELARRQAAGLVRVVGA